VDVSLWVIKKMTDIFCGSDISLMEVERCRFEWFDQGMEKRRTDHSVDRILSSRVIIEPTLEQLNVVDVEFVQVDV